MADPAKPDIRAGALDALEACRIEVVRRLDALKLALSVALQPTAIVPGESTGSWQSEQRMVQVSGLTDPRVSALIDDHSVPNRMRWGLHLGTLERSLLRGYRQGSSGRPRSRLGGGCRAPRAGGGAGRVRPALRNER
jgi:hypothetical protein